MNSLVRRTQSVDQMHSFLKDKQAWENAIAMYNGPDPLDHWYNYVCWYDNNIHGDPENKFRETLERCLTLFEHNEYYKQDNRMVKLWIKYIDMQPNPLNFYQVLYQRGIGRQCTSFYVNWAHYYDSLGAFKEAESVYNLGFQAKAQPFIDLQNAHSKFLYSISQRMIYEGKPDSQQCLQQTMEKLDESLLQTQQMNNPSHYHLHSHQEQMPLHESSASFDYNHHHNLQNQHDQQASHQIATQQEQTHQQFHNSGHQNHQSYIEHEQGSAAAATTMQTSLNYDYSETSQISPVNEDNERISQFAQSDAPFDQTIEEMQETPIDGIKLPMNFATYCRNNYEIWKPALFLEEPPDPNRRCKYAKDLVYPGNGVEYSPEEIRARKWQTNLEQVEQQAQVVSIDDIEEVKPVQSSNTQNTKPQQQKQKHLKPEPTLAAGASSTPTSPYAGAAAVSVAPVVTPCDDPENQIEASTIRFSTHSAEGVTKNKTIKIKFKKENRTKDDSVNGQESYSYSIDTTDFQSTEEVMPVASVPEKSRSAASTNNGSFHPYSSQTSTPKIKRSKKLKDINKFYVSACSNSNSSDYHQAAAIPSNPSNSNNYNYYDAKLLLTFSRDRESSSTTNGTERSESQQQTTKVNPSTSFSYNDNASFSFNESNYFENSNCSVTSAVDRLNFRENSQRYNENDISTYAENSFFASEDNREMKERRHQKALETIEKHIAKAAIDPFNSELCRAFLTKLNFPSDQTDNLCKIVNTPLPKFSNTRQVTLADVRYNIEKEVGRGSYGSVHKAVDTSTGTVVALKYQKPPNIWEIYICDEVLKRIKSPTVLPGIMDVSSAVIAPNASIIATEFSPYGSLLDINNKIRQATKKVMHESLVMHFSSQILNIIHHLHSSKIIHADIKPDNFLLMRVPNSDLHYPSLRLIDFGCAIDMTLFPDKTQFRKVIQTDGFTCIEMQENRPWSYETDLFCIAGTVHVMLFGEYMQLNKKFDTWDIKQKLPRYLKKHVWTKFFTQLLNIKNQDNLPNLPEMKMLFDEEAMKMDSELQNQIRTLSNLLHRR